MKNLLLLFSLLACNMLQAQVIEKIEIPKPGGSYAKNINLSEIASKIEYLPLETHKNALIGENAYCTLGKDYIFIEQPGTLWLFRRNGKFVSQISKIGKGPGEGFVRCFAFHEETQLIYIYNHYVHNILVFGFDGKFKKTIRDPFDGIKGLYVHNMNCDPKNGNVLLTFDNNEGKTPYKFVVMNPEGLIIHKEPNYDLYRVEKRTLDNAIGPSPLYQYQNSFHYRFVHNDTVFQINSDYKCVPKYVLRIPNKLTLEEDLKAKAYITRYADLNRNQIFSFYENNSFLMAYYVSNIFDNKLKKRYIAKYDKKTKQWTYNHPTEIINDIDGGLNNFYSRNESFMWGLIHPFDLKEDLTPAHFAKSKALYPDQQKKLKSLVDNIGEEDNPVLMIVTLK